MLTVRKEKKKVRMWRSVNKREGKEEHRRRNKSRKSNSNRVGKNEEKPGGREPGTIIAAVGAESGK